jgi:AraC family transcriptional regulator
MHEDTVERWLQRLERAANLLSANLEQPPELPELAAAAHVSPFHFHRIWRAMVGVTVGEWVRLQRIERATQALVETNASVTEIAMAAGFSSSQNFAKMLRREKGVSPTEVRLGAVSQQAPEPATDSLATAAVELVTLPDRQVIAKRRTGLPYSELNCEFEAVWAWAVSAGVNEQMQGIFGVPYDDDVSVPAELLRYDACMDFGDVQPTSPVQHLVLPAGDYARVRVVGSYEGLDAALLDLLRNWLIPSGREPADRPMFHQFLNDPDATPEAELLTDIYLPLEASRA